MKKEFKKIEDVTLESLSYIKPKMNVEIKVFTDPDEWVEQLLFEIEHLEDVIDEVKEIVEDEHNKILTIFINTITYKELLDIEKKQLEYDVISEYVEDNKKNITVREYMDFYREFKHSPKLQYEVYLYHNNKNMRKPQPIDFDKIN